MDKSQINASGVENTPSSSQEEKPIVENQVITEDSNIENTDNQDDKTGDQDDNFDDIPVGQAVPYERFKKVNDRMKANEEKAKDYDKLVPYAKVGASLLTKLQTDPEFKEDYQKAITKVKDGKKLTQADKEVLKDAKDIQQEDDSLEKKSVETEDKLNPNSDNKKYVSVEELPELFENISKNKRIIDDTNSVIDQFYEVVPEMVPSKDPVVLQKQLRKSEALMSVASFLHIEAGGKPDDVIPLEVMTKAWNQLTGQNVEVERQKAKLDGIETVLRQQASSTPVGNTSAGGSGSKDDVKITEAMRKLATKTGKTPERIAHLVKRGLLTI